MQQYCGEPEASLVFIVSSGPLCSGMRSCFRQTTLNGRGNPKELEFRGKGVSWREILWVIFVCFVFLAGRPSNKGHGEGERKWTEREEETSPQEGWIPSLVPTVGRKERAGDAIPWQNTCLVYTRPFILSQHGKRKLFGSK